MGNYFETNLSYRRHTTVKQHNYTEVVTRLRLLAPVKTLAVAVVGEMQWSRQQMRQALE